MSAAPSPDTVKVLLTQRVARVSEARAILQRCRRSRTLDEAEDYRSAVAAIGEIDLSLAEFGA